MSSSSLGVCFNPDCRDKKLDRPNKGWCLRSGEYVDLCNRCSFAFEQGRFCETFHLNASGWRCCESCKKRIHCGCIVSAQKFILLDAGGIGCIPCAKKNLFLTPNQVWHASSMLSQVPLVERPKDFSFKNWGHISGAGQIGPWRRPVHLANASTHSELNPRVPYGIDISSGLARLAVSEHSSLSQEKKNIDDPSERLINGNLKIGVSNLHDNGNSFTDKSSFHLSNLPLPSSLKDEPSTVHLSIPLQSDLPNGSICQTKRPKILSQRSIPSAPVARQFNSNPNNGFDCFNENHSRNGRPRGDVKGRNYLLSRYLPKMTDEELQRISGDSNGVITPLFEKTLSASDAGRIGRLVLPKKCAEAYFPPISQPEGLPIKVQDLEGQEWQFQFRFWPNNNSRMYVLEGVTPCIQSMKLQAGDTVTFSRLEHDGKLIMGSRKAPTSSVSRGNHSVETGNGSITQGDVNAGDPASAISHVDASICESKELIGSKPSFPRKRKSSTLGLKNKRLRIDNEEMMELKLTWEEAQGLLRPPCNRVPSVVVIEGYEFEEYEDEPILGRPTIFAGSQLGDGAQWAQCEDCLKWRRIPVDALLPSRWICSENSWDIERSSCSAAQELTTEQLEDLLFTSIPDACKRQLKGGGAKEDPITYEPGLDGGLDTLANLALLEEEPSSSSPQATTTKHPRHRPGCSCIVCIQPPSGKGPKHKQTCTCNVCLTVKRRFRTLMLRREKKLKGGEKKQIEDSSSNNGSAEEDNKSGSEEDEEGGKIMSCVLSPFKGQIDLNIQPEREDEVSGGSDSSVVRIRQRSLSFIGGKEAAMMDDLQIQDQDLKHPYLSDSYFCTGAARVMEENKVPATGLGQLISNTIGSKDATKLDDDPNPNHNQTQTLSQIQIQIETHTQTQIQAQVQLGDGDMEKADNGVFLGGNDEGDGAT